MNFRGLIILLLTLTCTACGGGGGGDEFSGAAVVTLDVVPTEVDTGDRIKIEVHAGSIYSGGIVVKVRYPNAFSYVTDTSFLKFDSKDLIDTAPDGEFKSDKTSMSFLVFTFDASEIADHTSATITFELQANQATSTSSENLIAVDADVFDSTTFDLNDPKFSSDDEVEVKVRLGT